ncbi:MAG: hypothetical protein RR450_07505 [Oscillospiraceae bacterium]
MNGCEHCKLNFCTCVERGGDAVAYAEQILRHFAPGDWVLRYRTLSDTSAMLCHIGSCNICGKQLCMGAHMRHTEGSFLTDLYWLYYHQWSTLHQPLEHKGGFPGMFLALFREDDKPAVTEWLQSPEHRHAVLIYGKEV